MPKFVLNISELRLPMSFQSEQTIFSITVYSFIQTHKGSNRLSAVKLIRLVGFRHRISLLNHLIQALCCDVIALFPEIICARPFRTLQHHALLQCLSQCTEVTPYLLVMEFCPLVSVQYA